jgi:hypothetical protein
MMEARLIVPEGKTPSRSLYSIIYRSNRKRVQNGEMMLFLEHRKDGERVVRYSLNRGAGNIGLISIASIDNILIAKVPQRAGFGLFSNPVNTGLPVPKICR